MEGVLRPTEVEGEQFRDLPARVRDHAATRPQAVALIDGETQASWADFAAAMERVAHRLASEGVRPGDVVASLGGVTADHMALYFGVLAAGAAMAPLPVSAHPDALAKMGENAGARLLFTDASAPVDGLPGMETRPLDGLIAIDGPRAQPVPITPDTLCDIIYSSGTTGMPKGIEHDSRFRDRQVQRLAGFGFSPEAVALISTPVYSNTTLVTLLPALGLGGTVVLMRKFSEVAWLELAERHRVTHTMLVPVQYSRLMACPDFDRFDLSAFRCKLCTSAPLPAPVIRDILARWPGRMVNLYGMTEGGVSCVLDAGAHPDKLHTVGRPARNAEVRIIGEDGQVLPPGEVGDVVGRAATTMLGYRHAPEATRAATWVDPEGVAWLRTGDMGRLDEDGFLTLMDRRKDVIISGGFNVHSSDLEAVLRDHPQVVEAAVIGVPSERWGETPVAFVVGAVEPEALRDWANARLGKTQRLSEVRIVERLPRSSIGKVLKRELRETWACSTGT